MRGTASNHTTQGDNGLTPSRAGQTFRRQGQFERAGHPHGFDVFGFNTVTIQRLDGGVQQPLGDQVVETTRHDSEMRVTRGKPTFHGPDTVVLAHLWT